MKIWAPHQGLLDRMATVSTRIPRPKTGWRIVLIVAGLLGSVTEVQLCDVSGCRPTGEISLLLLGVVIFSAGMLAFIDPAGMILNFWNAPSCAGDGSNRHEIAVA